MLLSLVPTLLIAVFECETSEGRKASMEFSSKVIRIFHPKGD
jgi:hypothetical protein